MEKDIQRNIPSDEGRKNDPHIRDESAAQPGINTVSSAPNDAANQNTTETASDNFRTEEWNSDAKADPSFDEVDNEDI